MPPILYDFFYLPGGSGPADSRSAMILLWIMIGTGVIFTGFFLVMRLAGRFRTTPQRALGETALLTASVAVLILVLAGRLTHIWLLYTAPLPITLAGYAIWARIRRGGRQGRSKVLTAWLAMVLDHEAGLFDGEVLKGAYRGHLLSELSMEQLRLLQVELVADPESVHILNAYLDYAHTGARNRDSAEDRKDNTYRANGERRRETRSGADGGMNEDEAWSLLGLARGASRNEIKTSYRRLMKQVHPDHGGTDYLAHKITQAKDLLLGL